MLKQPSIFWSVENHLEKNRIIERMTQAELLNNNKHFKDFIPFVFFTRAMELTFGKSPHQRAIIIHGRTHQSRHLFVNMIFWRGREDGQNKGKNMFPNDTALLPCFCFNHSVARELLPLASDCIHLGCHNLDVNIPLREKIITPGILDCECFNPCPWICGKKRHY